MNSPNLFDRKLGKFKLAKEVILKDPSLAFTILSTVIVIRAEYMFEDDSIHYTALNHNFDILGMGMIPPKYIATVEHGTMVQWERDE